ncbi:hypothetical protein BKA93DRAFT_733115 [Sparassis latifolia]
MDQVIENLWIGDLSSALNTPMLKANNIHSTFIRKQVNLDDTEDADILVHLVSAISFIEEELEKGHGVLVHCHAGLSRSATIVAAYLMYAQEIDAPSALEVIRKARPNVQPNAGFLEQLDIFHEASFKVSRRDKATRMFYLERVVRDVMNGDGSVETDMFAKYPRTPSDSAPATPAGPRRRIRCRMCRQELATREHMLDHGQLGPPTPASLSAVSPAASRRPSMHDGKPFNVLSPLSPISPPGSRRPSMLGNRPGSSLSPMSPPASRRPSTHEPAIRSRLNSNADNRPLKSSLLALDGAAQFGHDLSDALQLSESALEGDDDSVDEEFDPAPAKPERKSAAVVNLPLITPSASSSSESGNLPSVARRPSASSRSSSFAHPSDLAAQLYANPKLAALRRPSLSALNMSPISPAGPSNGAKAVPFSPPILANPKCSGYFVEPMKWMEPFLEEGQMAGKIVCPNKKCGAKLGNYDWAGVCCSCHEWVVPGFCIHRSKVDEVV